VADTIVVLALAMGMMNAALERSLFSRTRSLSF
jgi:hypothetical protein